jgi:diphthamide synthase (EF-2-diphthine--ammonia ligase)
MLTVKEMQAQTEAMLRKSIEGEGGDYEEFVTDLTRAFNERFVIVEKEENQA